VAFTDVAAEDQFNLSLIDLDRSGRLRVLAKTASSAWSSASS
jgi:hypothetical protein